MSVALRKPGHSDSFPLEVGGVAAGRRHGRGAQTNRSGRYEPVGYEPTDDGWESLAELDALATEVQEVPARRIITRNESPDIGFDRSKFVVIAPDDSDRHLLEPRQDRRQRL